MSAPFQNDQPQINTSSDDIVYNELYDLNWTPEHFEKKDEENEDFETIYSNLTCNHVCKFYNPYFYSGCQYGRFCQFSHLSESSFLNYCYYSLKKNTIDSTAEKTFAKAIEFIENDCVDKGYSLLKNLTLEYELNGHFNFWLGHCHTLFKNPTNKDYEIAQFYYRKSIAISPSNSSFHAYYAQFSTDWAKKLKLKVRCSEYKQAKDHFKKSLKLRSIPIVHFLFAKLLDEIEGEYHEAIYHYKTAIRSFQNDPRIRINYARCLHKIKRYSLSKQEFFNIFNIYKYQGWQCPIWPHFHFSKLLIDMQFYQQAQEELQYCINFMNKINNKYFSEIYYLMAKLQSQYLCKYNSAYQNIIIAIKLSPFRKYYNKLLNQIKVNIEKENERNKIWLKQNNNNPSKNENKGFDFGIENENNENDDCEKFIPFLMPTIDEESEEYIFDEENDDENDEENEFLANRFCATEFDRFISSDINYDEDFEIYIDKFENEKMNDIRILLKSNCEGNNKLLNEIWLKNKIGMNKKSIKIWKNSVNIFINKYKKYIQWLKKYNFYEKYFKKFQTFGILHLNSFFYHIKNQDDVLHMIGLKNKNDAKIIWKCAQNEKLLMIKSGELNIQKTQIIHPQLLQQTNANICHEQKLQY